VVRGKQERNKMRYYLKILTELEQKQPQEFGHTKKWIQKRYSWKETDLCDGSDW